MIRHQCALRQRGCWLRTLTITKVLVHQAGDKSWIVLAAALEALAKRGDPTALDTAELYIMDEKDIVRYTAAAATLRLIAIREARLSAKPRTR